MKKVLLALFISVFGLLILGASIATALGPSTGGSGLSELFTSDYSRFFLVIPILALVTSCYLFWGAIKVLTSSGDKEKCEKGYRILKKAVVRLIAIMITWFLLSAIV